MTEEQTRAMRSGLEAVRRQAGALLAQCETLLAMIAEPATNEPEQRGGRFLGSDQGD